jgi:hypothetical protein
MGVKFYCWSGVYFDTSTFLNTIREGTIRERRASLVSIYLSIVELS